MVRDNNHEIRAAAKSANVCHWEIAEKLGTSDCEFSKLLRRELPESKKQKVLSIIQELKQV